MPLDAVGLLCRSLSSGIGSDGEPPTAGGVGRGYTAVSMMDVRRADLHTHTFHSDGHLSPLELVEKARASGLAAIAVTDHDTVRGIAEAQEAGRKFGVEIIAGIELSVTVGTKPIHLLGYFFDPEHEGLRAHCRAFRESRMLRAGQVVERLSKLGMDLAFEAVLDKSAGGVIGRPHVAQAMVEAGFADSLQDAFQRYLGDGKPAHVPKPLFDAKDALALLRDAGGISVLAHPGQWTADATIMTLVRMGLDGLETIHPAHDAVLTPYYRQLARDMGLAETGGSDFHREGPDDRMGTITVPYLWIEAARSRVRVACVAV